MANPEDPASVVTPWTDTERFLLDTQIATNDARFQDAAMVLRQLRQEVDHQQQEIERLKADKTAPIHQRVWDLLRQMRSELLDAELITRHEYAWLCSEAPGVSGGGSPAPRRLETYDEIRARAEKAEQEIARLTAERDELQQAFCGVEEVHVVPGSFRARMRGEGVREFQLLVSEFFIEAGGKNYVEWTAGRTASIELADFVLTCQKRSGKTPGQLYTEATARADAAESALQRLHEAHTRLLEKWNDESCGVEAMGYSQQAERIRNCAEELAALAQLPDTGAETP